MKKLSLQEISAQRLRPQAALQANRFPLYVLLDNIRSLYNVGSIFRTADALRVQKVILTGITGKPPRKEIDKTALGAVDSVPWEYIADARQAVTNLKNQGVTIYALEQTSDSQKHWGQRYRLPCCLIIGNEVFGVSEVLLPFIDAAIEIPMYGSKHSLNAGTAFGVAGYEIGRQYYTGK